MNSELCRQALEKVGNPNVLVNLVSRRVRQLTSGGAGGRPLITDTAGLGAADIALIELIEGKLGWEVLAELEEAAEAAGKKKRKS